MTEIVTELERGLENARIQRQFDRLNARYWRRRLPSYRVIESNHFGGHGMCQSDKRCIHICPELSLRIRTKTLLHEMCHAATSGQNRKAWQNNRATPLRLNSVLKWQLKPILKKLGIKFSTRNGMHAFRHGRISYLAYSGVTFAVIRGWVGHGSDAMIKRRQFLGVPVACQGTTASCASSSSELSRDGGISRRLQKFRTSSRELAHATQIGYSRERKFDGDSLLHRTASLDYGRATLAVGFKHTLSIRLYSMDC